MKAVRTGLSFLIIGIFTLAIVTPVSAERIYKWEDDDGTVHFSTKKPFDEAEPAKLPEITRGEFKLAKTKLKTCDTHGGIDCTSGADTDGSVLCRDGFRDASARFRFSCSSPKLVISDISDLSDGGYFKVFVRNSRSVAAKSPKLEFHVADDRTVALTGPGEIEPFGMAEFEFQPAEGDHVSTRPGEVQFTLSCANCG